MDIKPIETVYNGYRFRSRLEARWAVFFDDAGIKYQYEPQGFELKDGSWYLPDFFLPWFNMYVEIKPSGMEDHVIEKAKIKLEKMFEAEFVHDDGEGIFVSLFIGDPLEKDCKWIYCNYSDDEGGGTAWFPFTFAEGATHNGEYGFTKHCITVLVGDDGYSGDDTVFLNNLWEPNYYITNSFEFNNIRSDLHHAEVKARQARFEHGECG